MSDIKNRCSWFFKNKLYMFLTIVIAIAAYGYEITHAVVGIDDICIRRYFTYGMGLANGRWPYFFLSQMGILGLDMYIPFLADFAAVLLLICASVCWCALFQRMFSRHNVNINIWCYIVFTGFYISHSMIAYVFIYYLHNGIAIAHLCIAIAILLWDDAKYCSNHKILRSITIVGLLTVAISFYESFTAVFILGLCIYWGIQEFYTKSKIIEYIKEIILMCVTLVMAIISRSIICIILGKIYGIPIGVSKARIAETIWKENIGNTISNIYHILKLNYGEYMYIQNIKQNPIMMLDLAFVIVCFFALFLTIKQKNVLHLFHAGIAIGSLFIMSVFTGKVVYQRSTQNMALFIGFAYFLIVNYVIYRKKYFQILVAVVLMVLEWNNLCTMNFLFYSESKNNERDIAVINDIGNRILSIGGEYKAVAFVGDYPWQSVDFNRISGVTYPIINQSIIRWGENAFENGNRELIHFFVLNGYWIDEVNKKQFEEAKEIAYDLPEYPLEGCIRDEGDYIIVKLGPLD